MAEASSSAHSRCRTRQRHNSVLPLSWRKRGRGTLVGVCLAAVLVTQVLVCSSSIRPSVLALLDLFGHNNLKSPTELQAVLPLPLRARQLVNSSREEVIAILKGEDDRLMVIVGPCSIHDLAAAREYATRLQEVAVTHREDLLVAMRVYLEKPRTAVGWRGLVSDPELTGAENLEEGLAMGRRVLLDVAAAGLPAATEFLDPLVAPYVADLISYGSIGARTVESPQHRAMAANLPMPIGFKNGRGGSLQDSVNAAIAASQPQRNLGIDPKSGHVSVIDAAGNRYGHVVLRGSEDGPNFDSKAVAEAADRLGKAGFEGRRVVIDCSHGNKGGTHDGQLTSCGDVARQLAENGESSPIGGVMIESFLEAGRQSFEPGVTPKSQLRYGQSITDACLDFASTETLIGTLANAARERRRKSSSKSFGEAIIAAQSDEDTDAP